MFVIGDVIILSNIQFEDNHYEHKYVLDHAKGRPCLVIGFVGEFYYYMPIHTASYKDMNHMRKVIIKKDRFNGLQKEQSAIDVKALYKREIFFHKVIGSLSYADYLRVIKGIILYNTKVYKHEFFDDIFPQLSSQVNEFQKKLK